MRLLERFGHSEQALGTLYPAFGNTTDSGWEPVSYVKKYL